MSLTVSFSFESKKEKVRFEKYAASKGITLWAMAKLALYQYKAKYPYKGAKKREVEKVGGQEPIAPKTVQPAHVKGNEGEG